MPPKKKFDVFLSHNSKDKPWVIKLKGSLETLDIKVWLDKDEIRPGDLFAKALERGIEESKAVALVISPESMASGWVEAEYYRALSLATNNQLQLIPVLYKKAQIPGFLSDRSWVDFGNESEYDEKVRTLVWGITGKKPKVEKKTYASETKLSQKVIRTRNENALLLGQMKNAFIRYLERKLRMENAHWIRVGMSIPIRELNFTAVYFQAQIEIFNNIQEDLNAICDKLAEDKINLTQDAFLDAMNNILRQINLRVQQIEDLIGVNDRQYDLGISLQKAAKVVHEDVNTVDQHLNTGAMTLLSQPSECESISDNLRTGLTDLAISVEEFQKHLSQTYINAKKEIVSVHET